jgi:uncharacterized repeat protein (TIGR02543 family)
MKKFAIALCLAATFATPLFALDPCTETAQLNASATGAQTWNGTKSATTVGGSGDDAYGVEAWTEAGGNATKLTWYGPSQGGGYAFKAEWTNSTDYLGRFGYFWGSGGKKWSALGDLCVDYNYKRSANGSGGSYSYIGIYGWTIGSNNSAEYYIVEDWFGSSQQAASNLGNNCQTHSNITVDGKTYQVVTCIRPQGSGCVSCNNQAFGQVFSIRQGMRNPEPAKCGTISIKKHFEEWIKQTTEKGGQSPAKYIYDKTYESKFLVEAAGGTGNFDATYMKFSRTGDCGVTIPAGNYTLAVAASPTAGGTVTKSPSASYYSSGSSVTVTATPATGYQFDGWDGSATGTTNPLSVAMNANKTVTAKFSRIPDATTNLVKNGNFTNTDNWTLNKWQNSAGTFAVSGGNANITAITLPSGDGAAAHSLQLVQNGIELTQGTKYLISFDASAASARTIGLVIQMDIDPWTGYYEKDVSLTTTKQTFTYEFEMTKPTDDNSRIAFNFGGATPNVTISNVKIGYALTGGTSSSSSAVATSSSSSMVEISSSSEDPKKKKKNRIPATHFSVQTLSDKALRIEVNSPSVVEIFDLKGNKSASFDVSGTQTVKLSLPNGVYFAKVKGMKSLRFVLN